MPHSVSPEDPESPVKDVIIEEPKAENVETQQSEGTAVANSMDPIRESQTSDDLDMTMAGVGAVEEMVPVKAECLAEVKLEDLFADMDSDEEFPSSTGQDGKISSSPDAPASPV
jgi:DNA primase small subunit